MTSNVGRTDRRVRIGLGLIILLLGMLLGSWWGLIGLVLLITGYIRWCPVYAPFKFSTVEHAGI